MRLRRTTLSMGAGAGLLLAIALIVQLSRTRHLTVRIGPSSPGPSAGAGDDTNDLIRIRHLRIRVIDHDDTPVPGCRVALLSRETRSREPLALDETDAIGEASFPSELLQGLGNAHIWACRYQQDLRLLWTEHELDVFDWRQSGGKPVELRFAGESFLEGTMSEFDGRPAAGQDVVLRFGWIGGPGDPRMFIFGKLKAGGESNRLTARTDESGKFRFSQLPACISFSFFGGGEDRGYQYEIDTDLPPRGNTRTWFQTAAPGTYHASISRVRHPAFTLTVRLPDHAPPEKAWIWTMFVQLPSDPRLQDGASGFSTKEGLFSFRMSLLEGMRPDSLHGNKMWILVHHPELGTHFFVRRIDSTTFSDEVEIGSRTEGRTVEGFLVDEDNQPLPGMRLTLKGVLFRSGVVGETSTDGQGHFRFDHLPEVPEWWKQGQFWTRDPNEYVLRFEAPKKGGLVFEDMAGMDSLERPVRPGVVYQFVVIDLVKRHMKKP